MFTATLSFLPSTLTITFPVASSGKTILTLKSLPLTFVSTLISDEYLFILKVVLADAEPYKSLPSYLAITSYVPLLKLAIDKIALLSFIKTGYSLLLTINIISPVTPSVTSALIVTSDPT